MFSKKIAMLLVVTLALVTLSLMSACNAQPQTVTVVETVVVEKEVPGESVTVVETVVVEKEVEVVKEVEVEKEVMVEIQGAIPYPEGVPLNLEEAVVERQPISEIVAYKALPEYHEPEWVTALVEAGELPPVEERLPKEPQVVLTSGMPNGIGVYGDTWRDFSACPTAGWNYGAGVTSGWFGIEAMSSNEQALVQTGPLYRADQDVEPFPQLAKSWEWSEDGKELTMHLIEGAKWSDGEPFTSEDVLFTWEDYINDPNVNAWKKSSNWEIDGQPTTLEAVDEFTIKFTFPVEKPVNMYYFMDEQDFSIMPAHLLKPLHPKYNTDMDYKEFENALPPDALPQVTMGPWAATEYREGELLIMRRNPYYWKVDEDGNQLPYIDEATYQKGPSGTGRTLCTVAGGCDHSNLENPQSEYTVALKAAQEPDAHFDINWGPEVLAFELALNLSADLGVKDEKQAAMRELFRDLRFRRALTQAMDRDGLAQATMRGPFLRAWPGGLVPGSPEFDRNSVVYYPYAPDAAKALLAELGFEDTDGNGVLNWTSGPLEGEDLTIAMMASEDAQEGVNLGQALVNTFAQVGIKVNFRPVTSAAILELNVSGEWETRINRVEHERVLPFAKPDDLVPLGKNAPAWHVEGDTPRQLQPFEEEMVDLLNQYLKENDLAKRKELINQLNQIWTENVYTLGIWVGRHGLALAKRFQNVPSGTPVFMYQWVEDNYLAEAIWSPAEEQLEQVRPNTIPVYNTQ
jgi:peptide/nickel transport system substrate-binding protein